MAGSAQDQGDVESMRSRSTRDQETPGWSPSTPGAGPSNYWHKSSSPTPSPPPAWRTLSTEPWPENLEEGYSDVWHRAQPVSIDGEGGSQADNSEFDNRLRTVRSRGQWSARSSISSQPASSRPANGAGEGALANGFGSDDEEFGHASASRNGGLASPASSRDALLGSPVGKKPQRLSSYVHPSISRLRSSHLRSDSSSSIPGRPSQHARTPSHFSQISVSMSRSESQSTVEEEDTPPASPAFTFTPLRRLSNHLVRPKDEQGLGKATVMDVKGMIAVGTSSGAVVVYDFAQELRCLLSPATPAPVTAVTISPDQTYVGVGYANGNIHLFDLSSPAKPARTALALTPKQAASGRKEGHLQNSQILHVDFVGNRHTAIITGDEHGRAFWMSLGRVMGVDSNDILRILGSYPTPDDPRPTKQTTLFVCSPLAKANPARPLDVLHLTALLTPQKLVVVGLKPEAKTHYRRIRAKNPLGTEDNIGCLAWNSETSDPVFAYAWGREVRIVKVTPGREQPEGPSFTEGLQYTAPSPVLAIQWFDEQHLLLVTKVSLLLLDTLKGRPVEQSPFQTQLLAGSDVFSRLQGPEPTSAIYGSVRLYREKIFTLTKSKVQVGSLSRWNDRILHHVHSGDFLNAIRTALAYYESRGPGNAIGLPSEKTARAQIVGTRIRELMQASLQWAFSEDRMKDDTHYSRDGRGVDRTSLFEQLAIACIEACLSMDDKDFMFDEVFERYSNAGIHELFLRLLEPYVFDGRLRQLPPTISKALISMHEGRDELRTAEALLWHIDPMALDINQAVSMCEANHLWDALVHVYTRAMRDYLTPLDKLLREGSTDFDVSAKVFAYLEHVLCGLSYPSGESLPPEEANQARRDIYDFLSDRSNLVALIELDLETFLHSLDIAFEDPYLNDTAISVNRQAILNALLDTVNGDEYGTDDETLLNIFVARNLPKYPQFLLVPPSTLYQVLYSLTQDPNTETREDRQLATEFLLSAYTPDRDIEDLLISAGFYRILRTTYRRDKRWADLVAAYIDDKDLGSDLFADLDEILQTTKDRHETESRITPRLQLLLHRSIHRTAEFLDKHFPLLHYHVLDLYKDAEFKQLSYLECLFSSETKTGEDHATLRLRYIVLLSQHRRASVVDFLDSSDVAALDLDTLYQEFGKSDFHEGQIWALDRQNKTKEAFDAAKGFMQEHGTSLVGAVVGKDIGAVHLAVESLQAVSLMAVRLCREHSIASDAKAENLWFDILRQIIEIDHNVAQACDDLDVITSMRSLVQSTLQSLIVCERYGISFPRIFRRLVGTKGKGKTRGQSELRTIVSGMLDSYRMDSDMLRLTIELLKGDLFGSVQNMAKSRSKGWRAEGGGQCDVCADPLGDDQILVRGTGSVVHVSCAATAAAGS